LSTEGEAPYIMDFTPYANKTSLYTFKFHGKFSSACIELYTGSVSMTIDLYDYLSDKDFVFDLFEHDAIMLPDGTNNDLNYNLVNDISWHSKWKNSFNYAYEHYQKIIDKVYAIIWDERDTRMLTDAEAAFLDMAEGLKDCLAF
jgi:hypothetical protein